jgi:hypothetical protein
MAWKRDPKQNRARVKAWRAISKDKIRVRGIQHRAENWTKHACWRLRTKAKSLDIKFDMQPEDLQIPSVCPFTLLPFVFGTGTGRNNPQSPSVDRIKPDRGYVRGNVRVISFQANCAMHNITDPDVFQRLADDARIWSLV